MTTQNRGFRSRGRRSEGRRSEGQVHDRSCRANHATCPSDSRPRRRYPFTESTKIIELVDKKHYGDVVRLTERLKPLLKDGETGAFLLTGLFFDLEKVSGQRQFVIDELALFIKKVKDAGGLKYRQSVLIRYFSSPEHCNLEISEKSLKPLILEAKRRCF